jgi:hypothetical protein
VQISQSVDVLTVAGDLFNYGGLQPTDWEGGTGYFRLTFAVPITPGDILFYSAGGPPIVTTAGNVQLPISLTVV